jgi:hypothetical protein
MKHICVIPKQIDRGKQYLLYGVFEESRNLFIRLVCSGIEIAGFVWQENDELDRFEDYTFPPVFGLKVYSVDECLAMKDDICIIIPFSIEEKLPKEISVIRETIDISLNQQAVIVYGTGETAVLLHDLVPQIDVECYIDSDERKQGSLFCNKVVETPEYLCENSHKIVLMAISHKNIRAVERTVSSMGVEPDNIYYYCGLDDAVIVEGDSDYSIISRETMEDCIVVFAGHTLRVKGDVDDRIVDILKAILPENICFNDAADTDSALYVGHYDYSDLYKNMNPCGKKPFYLENFNIFQKESIRYKLHRIPDPTLGFIFRDDDNKDRKEFDFLVNEFGETSSQKRILILGNSTTWMEGIKESSWSEYLSEMLNNNMIPYKMYNGAVGTFLSSQELLRLIRDGIWLKPDIVISYSGCTNMYHYYSVAKENPFLNSYQTEVAYNENQDVYYGVNPNCSLFEYWFEQERMMEAVCKANEISFFSFLQPIVFSGRSFLERTAIVALYNNAVWNNSLGRYDNHWDGSLLNEKNKGFRELVQNAFAFRKKAKEVKEDWFIDLSGLFDDTDGVFLDRFHLNEKGNKIVANVVYETLQKACILT